MPRLTLYRASMASCMVIIVESLLFIFIIGVTALLQAVDTKNPLYHCGIEDSFVII